jgi:hypothetical protein
MSFWPPSSATTWSSAGPLLRIGSGLCALAAFRPPDFQVITPCIPAGDTGPPDNAVDQADSGPAAKPWDACSGEEPPPSDFAASVAPQINIRVGGLTGARRTSRTQAQRVLSN